MGGGLMQLVAYGAQDIYLTGNPQITFFKVVYRRHTNFSMEAIEQTWNGAISTDSSSVTATISRNGDLVTNLWLAGTITTTGAITGDSAWSAFTNNTGHALIKDVEIEIGGQRIDRHYSQWLDVWNELTDHDAREWTGLNKHEHHTYGTGSSMAEGSALTVYVPLQFWFCRNPGLALPLIALQYHEVKVKLTTNSMKALTNQGIGTTRAADTGNAADVKLWADYIYLDTDERRRFAQVSHEYLIEQVQRETGTMAAGGGTHSQKLNFNHPVKELIWVGQVTNAVTVNAGGTAAITAAIDENGGASADAGLAGADTLAAAWVGNDWFNYGPSTGLGQFNSEYLHGETSYEHFDTAQLKLNGHDRFAKRKASYFRLCQPLQAGHRVSGMNTEKKIYCYSFALKPEEHQPSGTCNFSRIDNAKLDLVFTNITTSKNLTVYAINYNVLRIMSGMGGLAYSN